MDLQSCEKKTRVKKSTTLKKDKVDKVKPLKINKPIIEDVTNNYKFCCDYLKNNNGYLFIG